MIRWYIADRAQGKTTDLITWVKLGKRKQGWPYWTRIIIEPNRAMADQLRGKRRPVESSRMYNKYGLDYHQVFYFDEWKDAHRGRLSGSDHLEIGLDNVDILLGYILGAWGQIARATATGDPSRWPELIAMEEEQLYPTKSAPIEQGPMFRIKDKE